MTDLRKHVTEVVMQSFDRLPQHVRRLAWEYPDAGNVARFTLDPSKIIAACEFNREAAAFKNYGSDHPQAGGSNE